MGLGRRKGSEGGATPSPLPATPGQAEPAPSTAEAEDLADELGVFFALGPSLDAGDEVARQLKMRQGAMNELVSTETRCAARPACAVFNAALWLQNTRSHRYSTFGSDAC